MKRMILRELGRLKQALWYFDRFLELKRSEKEVWLYRGLTLFDFCHCGFFIAF
jgi:hypothetical protein